MRRAGTSGKRTAPPRTGSRQACNPRICPGSKNHIPPRTTTWSIRLKKVAPMATWGEHRAQVPPIDFPADSPLENNHRANPSCKLDKIVPLHAKPPLSLVRAGTGRKNSVSRATSTVSTRKNAYSSSGKRQVTPPARHSNRRHPLPVEVPEALIYRPVVPGRRGQKTTPHSAAIHFQWTAHPAAHQQQKQEKAGRLNAG